MQKTAIVAAIFILLANSQANAADEPYLGIMVSENTRIIHVIPDSPAKVADLRHGDFIVDINRETNGIHSAAELQRILSAFRPGQKIVLTVMRISSGDILIKEIKLANRINHPLKKFPHYEIKEWSGALLPPTSQTISGSPAIFLFTATWCPPCKKLAPMISKMYHEMERSFGKKLPLSMAAVAWAEDSEDREEYQNLVKYQIEKAYYSFGVMLSLNLWQDARVRTIPTLIIVDRDNYIVGRYGSADLLPDQCARLQKEILEMIYQDPTKKLNLL